MCCPFRQKKISPCLTVHAQWILCLHHLRSGGFCHLLCSFLQREIVGKPGIWGEGAAAGLHWGAGKGGEVQSRLAHTRFLLAWLVQSQTRGGTMSGWVQKGKTLNQRVVQKGRDANSHCLHVGSWCSRDCPMHLGQHAVGTGPDGDGAEAGALPG